jgi:NADH-quinone oxidoreductase subunit N
MVWLAVVGVLFSLIGAFYYLRIVKLMYFDQAETSEPLVAGWDTRAALSVNGLAMLYFGLFPAGLLSVCSAAFG